MPRTSRPITVILSDLALHREDVALNVWLRQHVDVAFTDPGPNLPVRDIFKRLRGHHAKRMNSGRDEKG